MTAGHTVKKRFNKMEVGSGWGTTRVMSVWSGLECCRLFHQSSLLCERGGAWAPTTLSSRCLCRFGGAHSQNLPPTQPPAANGKTWKRRWLAAVQVNANRAPMTAIASSRCSMASNTKRRGVSSRWRVFPSEADLRCMQRRKVNTRLCGRLCYQRTSTPTCQKLAQCSMSIAVDRLGTGSVF